MFSIVATMRDKVFGPISCRSFFVSTETRHADRAGITPATRVEAASVAKQAAAQCGLERLRELAPPPDGPALQRAVAMVKQGQPALVDVVTQPR